GPGDAGDRGVVTHRRIRKRCRVAADAELEDTPVARSGLQVRSRTGGELDGDAGDSLSHRIAAGPGRMHGRGPVPDELRYRARRAAAAACREKHEHGTQMP